MKKTRMTVGLRRFYFHIRDGQDLVEDTDGVELAGAAAVKEEAILAAREILAERVKRGEWIGDQMFEIVDESGVIVEIVPFKAALLLERK